jgi:hypothetical protein
MEEIKPYTQAGVKGEELDRSVDIAISFMETAVINRFRIDTERKVIEIKYELGSDRKMTIKMVLSDESVWHLDSFLFNWMPKEFIHGKPLAQAIRDLSKHIKDMEKSQIRLKADTKKIQELKEAYTEALDLCQSLRRVLMMEDDTEGETKC